MPLGGASFVRRLRHKFVVYYRRRQRDVGVTARRRQLQASPAGRRSVGYVVPLLSTNENHTDNCRNSRRSVDRPRK